MIKSISKKQIGLIGGLFGLILLVIIVGGGDNKNNQIPEQEGQQTQASLNQSIQNISTPEKGIENENVALAEEILTRKRQVKARAAVIGGELVACEVAEFLADQGKEVTILRRGPEIAMTILPYLREALIERLACKGVKMLTGVKYEEITPDGIIITDRHGKRLLIKADVIILAAGAHPNQNLFNKLIGKINELYLIGDAVEPRRIREAIHDAAKVARQI